MKDKKRRLELFSFYDRTGIEAHLEAMAAQGWLLEKIGALWTYRRIEPKKLAFSVCYFAKASQYDPEPSEEQEMFYEFCAHTGWTLAAASAQMQIFYNERENPIPIETDPATEVDAIHRSAKRSFLLSYFILLGSGLMGCAMQLWLLLDDPVQYLSNSMTLFAFTAEALLIILVVVELTCYFRWRRGAVRAAERGEFLPTRSRVRFQWVMMLLVVLNMAFWLASSSLKWAAVGAMSLVGVLAVVALTLGISSLLKRRKAPAGVNQAVTVLVCLLLSGVLVAGEAFYMIRAARTGRGEAYTAFGLPYTAYQDTIPLTVEDLTGEAYEGGVREIRSANQSPLLARTVVSQYPRWDNENRVDMPWLDYTVLTPRLNFQYGFWYSLYRDCLLRQSDQRLDRRVPEGYRSFYRPTDPAPWGAEEAYQLATEDGRTEDKFLLCYPYHILEIRFGSGWGPLTPEQMRTVGETFGGSFDAP